MEVCTVNFNIFEDDLAVDLLQEIAAKSCIDYFIFFGGALNGIDIPLDILDKCICISEYPVSEQCIKELVAIYALLNVNDCNGFYLYEYGNSKEFVPLSTIPIYNYLYTFIFRKDVGGKKKAYIENILNEMSTSENGLFQSFYKDLSPIISNIIIDNEIWKLYNSEINGCLYKELDDDYWGSLNNSKISDFIFNIFNAINRSIPVKEDYGLQAAERVKLLRDVVDDYIIYSKFKNERASLLYCALLIKMALFYKNALSSNLAYSLLLRTFEISATFFLLKKDALVVENGQICMKGTTKSINGVNILKIQLEVCNVNIDGRIISKLIKIRNKSLVGHGFNFPHIDDFNECYAEVSRTLQKILKCEEYEYYKRCFDAFSFLEKSTYLSEMKKLFPIKKV